jgi:hypothetical protein
VDRERYYEQKAKMRDALEQKLGITVEPFVSYRDLDVYVSNADGEPVTVELAGVITVRVQDLIELAGRLAKHDPA